jgi:nucleotidyltransferase substrate binding protein (TIGR01987 family)
MISYTKIAKASHSLRSALNQKHFSELERDGVIQRFEYTFELSWKLFKQYLLSTGIRCNSPKDAIRELAKQGALKDPERWMGYLTARNYTSHTYDKKVAEWVFATAKDFISDLEKLLDVLKND